MDDALSFIAIGIASASAVFAFWQTKEFIKQTRLAYLPYILPRYYDQDNQTDHPYMILENVGNGIAIDVHLTVQDMNETSLGESLEIYAFEPKVQHQFREINLNKNKQLRLVGYYFDTARKKHSVEIEFEYPPKIIKNKQ